MTGRQVGEEGRDELLVSSGQPAPGRCRPGQTVHAGRGEGDRLDKAMMGGDLRSPVDDLAYAAVRR